MDYANTIGIEAAAGEPEGSLVYEFKVPLAPRGGQPFAVLSLPGHTIGLRFETGELPQGGARAREGERPGGGGGNGGYGGGGYGGRGGMGGHGGGYGGGSHGQYGATQAKPVKLWTVVHLAAPPA